MVVQIPVFQVLAFQTSDIQYFVNALLTKTCKTLLNSIPHTTYRATLRNPELIYTNRIKDNVQLQLCHHRIVRWHFIISIYDLTTTLPKYATSWAHRTMTPYKSNTSWAPRESCHLNANMLETHVQSSTYAFQYVRHISQFRAVAV